MNRNLNYLENRAKTLRRSFIDLAKEKRESHIGGSLSMIELILSVYDVFLKSEDKFILSKGHSSFPLYLLLRERGYNPHISTHPEIDVDNGINATTGSLGHGLPIGTGIALSKKLKKEKGNVYVLMSDGECQEGTTWESLLIASQHRLDNLTIMIDYNKIQGLTRLDEALSLNDLASKLKAFNTCPIEIDGHNFLQIISALEQKVYDRPKAIIAHTVKGKGISCFEDNPKWHSKIPSEEEFKIAYEELK